MDAQAWQIRELVCGACELVARVEGRGGEATAVAELEYLRNRLLILVEETEDVEAQGAACGVVAEIDAALRWHDQPLPQRGAA